MPVITLTTDFGISDHFVGTMKGVIAGIAPKARVIDISHLVTPHRIDEGGFVLAQAYRYFPEGTIHVAVIDPGVGTARRALLVESADHYFIGPDNGIFTMMFENAKVRAIENRGYFLEKQSSTFHGRDVFAPCAAHLARGAKPKSFGPEIADFVRSPLLPVQTGDKAWTGQVLKVDHFGNLITNLASSLGKPKTLKIARRTISGFVANYQEAASGKPFVIAGSSGYFEISVREASAQAALGCGAGTPLELTLW